MTGYMNSDGSALIGALNPSNQGQALQVDGSGSLKVASGVSNPVVTQDQIRAWINNGQGFSATTGKLMAPGQITGGFSVFNPAASGKTLLVYSLTFFIGNTSFNVSSV